MNGTAPAALEWTLKYSTADITSATLAVGSAATAAGKQLSCTSSAGSSTCLLWGINSQTISSGVVATVALTLSPTTQNTSSSIQLVNGVAAASSGAALTTSTAGSTLSIVTAGGGSGPIDLSPAFNVIGIVGDGTVFGGGLDGNGNAYSANLLGSNVNADGTSFALGSPNVNNAVANTTVTLPAGQFASLAMLATAVNGNQPSQTFTLTYTDGTTSNFVQSLSDWHTPQNYSGEIQASSMAYRDLSTGLEQIRTTSLYGYLFALDSSKIVESIQLPANSNVLVLAMTLTTAPPSPDFSLVATPGSQTVAAGNATSYTAVVTGLNQFSGTVSLSASGLPAGAAVTFSPTSVSGSGSATVNLSTLSSTRSGSYTVTISGVSGGLGHSATITLIVNSISNQVDLSSAYSRVGIASDGTTFTGGFDDSGHAYSANLLRAALTVDGTLFTFGPANAPDVVSSTTVVLTTGQFSTLAMLGAAVHGNQPSQTFTVTYTDGTSSFFTQSLSDWHTPQGYDGETQVSTMAYRNVADGTEQIRTFYLNLYSFALDNGKTVKSLTFPDNDQVGVLAITLIP